MHQVQLLAWQLVWVPQTFGFFEARDDFAPRFFPSPGIYAGERPRDAALISPLQRAYRQGGFSHRQREPRPKPISLSPVNGAGQTYRAFRPRRKRLGYIKDFGCGSAALYS
jgi:hypothetical protein